MQINKKINLLIGLILFLITTISLYSFERYLRPEAVDGVYFLSIKIDENRWHGFPSEEMMQTAPIEALRDEPLKSLWYLHIQPPLFDSIRALLAQVYSSSNSYEMLKKVDKRTYDIWAFVYGLMALIIYLWLSKLTSIFFALIASVIFALHPAVILYATYLETTLASSFLILLLVFKLWKISNNESVNVFGLIAIFLLLFFIRSIFQWQWLIIITACLILLQYPRRKILIFFISCACVIFLFLMKQFILFGLTTTSSFTGYNLCRSINVCEVSPAILNAIPASPRDVSIEPKVLSENKKLTGSENFNTRNYLLLNAEYLKQYREKIKEIPISKLLNIYYQNLIIYLQPSSNYNDSNKLLNFLPSKWRSTYEIIFSYPYLVILLFFSVLIWVFRSDTKKLKGLVISLPVFLIFITSILFESGENMRFKFFIEPIIYIFICSQLYFIGCKSFNFLKQK
jgi:hypothetical protein